LSSLDQVLICLKQRKREFKYLLFRGKSSSSWLTDHKRSQAQVLFSYTGTETMLLQLGSCSDRCSRPRAVSAQGCPRAAAAAGRLIPAERGLGSLSQRSFPSAEKPGAGSAATRTPLVLGGDIPGDTGEPRDHPRRVGDPAWAGLSPTDSPHAPALEPSRCCLWVGKTSLLGSPEN